MNQEELYNKMLDLAPSEYDGLDYLDHIQTLFENYILLLKDYDSSEHERQSQMKCVISKAERICESLVKCVKEYYTGLYSKSYDTLKASLEALPKWKVAHKFTSYKIRVVDDGTKPTFEGMFHIPYDKRGIIRTQRYSAPGLPCLYLGMTPFTCWEEMRRPQLDKTYISKFQPHGFYKYLPFGLPLLSAWQEGELANKKFLDDLLYFPFVIVSMVKVAKCNIHFKPEYIIPQMIVQWLLENRSNVDDYRKMPIGVLYTSVHFDKTLARLYWDLYTNLAIPCYYEGERKYSRDLSKWFNFTEPIALCDIIDEKMKTNGEEIWMMNIHKVLCNEEKYPLKSISE